MIKKFISLIFVLIFIPLNQGFAQLSNQNPNEYYYLAVEESERGNISDAIKLFRLSISEYGNPDSYYELAKIYFGQNTVESRVRARELIQKAIWKRPKNIEYRLFQAKLMESFSRNLAFRFYEDITNIDNDCTEALFNLGRIKEAEYYEYINSVLQVESDPALSFDRFAIEDFLKAERFFKSAIKSDSSCLDAYIHLANMYEDIGEPEKGIAYLKKVIDFDPENKEAILLLGLLYYKTSQIDSSSSAYETALNLMNAKEKDDFKFQSASFLVQNNLSDKLNVPADSEFEQTVNNYWKVSDPLFLTDYNERLLEHFSRVIYSNLKFSLRDAGLPGWDSDRGETVIRYGEPIKRVRYRPYINAGGRTQLMLKTDFWYYKDKVLGFVDEYWNENYRFSSPRPGSRHVSQFPGDADFFMNDLRRTEPESYNPKFEGPVIQVPINIVQFKNLERDSLPNTQVYINYALDSYKKISPDDRYPLAHKYGIFFFKEDSEIETKKLDRIIDLDYKRDLKISLFEEYMINSVLVDLPPDSGVLAFEIIRDTDNGVFAKRTNFKIKNFSETGLDISDIILASDVNKSDNLSIRRKDLNLLPNPLNTFTVITKIFIYYEVYNLSSDEKGISNFEQQITISKINETSGLGNFFNSLIGIIGLGDSENTLTLTTEYQSYERDTPVYLQLDMSKYEKGDYKINIEIKDLLDESVVSSQTILRWK
ncbi:MAG: GWxTD domain-containing protein [Ignavibacteriaceae bacterium]